MARSDLLINLVKSSASGDRLTLRKTVEAIVAEERAKQHNVVADRIEKAYHSANGHGGSATMNAVVSEHSSRARDFIAEVTPRRRLEDLILPETTLLSVQQLIEEQQRASSGDIRRSPACRWRRDRSRPADVILVGSRGGEATREGWRLSTMRAANKNVRSPEARLSVTRAGFWC